MSITLIASLLLALPVAVVSLTIGALLVRKAHRESTVAPGLLGTFWLGVGAYTAVEASWNAAVAFGMQDLVLARIVLSLKLLGSIAGFGGLVAYLLLIYTGRRGVLMATAFAYLALYSVSVYYYVWRGPVGVTMGHWGAMLEYARPGGGLPWKALVAAWFVPPVLASFGYASLMRYLTSPAQRYRLTLVSVGFVLFFTPALFGWIAGSWMWWGLIQKLLACVSTFVFLAAFQPPAAARRRFGAQRVLDQHDEVELGAKAAEERTIRLRARASQLV